MSEGTERAGAIAIVGMSGRFPGAGNLDDFWRNLREGVESITFFSRDELDTAAIDPAELDDPTYVKARGVLEGADMFDASFFDFSPREAELTDPQHRLFLECVWEALENAGYDPSRPSGSVGLFGGAGANGYLLWNLASAGHLTGTARAFQAIIHNRADHLTTRVGYKLDLKGPIVTVQTACSTSLVAVALACQSLLDYQCDMALAGGVAIPVPQRVGYLYHERGIGSPDGHCRPFDAKAQGTVAGSGAGVVALKRLDDAIAHGDTIYAVIRGAALNNDGGGKVGYTAPSVEGQAEAIATAHALAQVAPETISYVEAHGTGTPLGDPIEVEALTRAFRRQTAKINFCALGALKANVGHLDAAAGVAGLIKTVLALKHRELPPNPHFEQPNPEIPFATSPFFVNAERRPWEGPRPLRAGVSSFGLGGTNAHVVLEEAPPPEPSGPSRPAQLLVLSARNDAALEAATTRLVERLRAESGVDLADVAYTLYEGRKSFEHRRIVVCRDVPDAIAALSALSPDRVFSRVQEPVRRPVSFMFPGQGSQYPGMAAGLYQAEATFRDEVDRCLDALRRRHDLDLRPLLLPDDPRDPAAARRLEQTALTQPALFVVEYALAKLLMSWGLEPASMIGHSVGEYVAAALAGVFSVDDALDLVAVRGRLMQSMPAGAMLSVQLPERELAARLEPGLEIAAANGPAACVVAGPIDAIEAFERRLAGEQAPCRRLRTSHAFHSSMMDPIVARFRDEVRKVRRSAPKLRFVSNVTGTWITNEQAVDPEYWAKHLRSAVRFGEGLDELLKEPEAVLLEVGPGRALRTIARWHPRKKSGQFMLPCLPTAEESAPAGGREAAQADEAFLLRTLGHVWLTGVEPPRLFAGERRRRVPLPTYAFQRSRYWVDLRAGGVGREPARGSLEKQADVGRWFYVPVWRQTPVPAPTPPAGEADRGAPWLLLLDGTGFGARLSARLRASGREVIEVGIGRAFRRAGADAYELNPARREDYAALLSELRADGRMPSRVVHLFALGADGAGGAAGEDALTRSFFSLVFLAQAAGGQKVDQPLSFIAVTDRMQEVTGGDLAHPAQATVLGPCQVIPREYPSVSCRSVDVALTDEGAIERLVPTLVAELAGPATDGVVAFRGGRRWVQAFESVRLDRPTEDGLPLRPGGVYLITGGLGGIGLSVAEHLARRAPGATIALVSRSKLPERSAWGALLADEGADPADRRRVEAIQRLEGQGAKVEVRSVDVTDPDAVRGVVAELRERFGALHGVVHAAGVAGGGLIQLKTREAAAAVLAPKVAGTVALLDALGDAPIDFFVGCSSLTTVVGRLGQVDYTAANAFLDAAVQAYAARTGALAVAVDWGAWEEVGMAARPSAGAGDRGRPFGHPLLERCLEDSPARQVFATDFGVSTQWVVDEHRILGNPAVPGVTYFEMVRAALAPRAGGRAIEISDVFFLAPMRVPETGAREVRLIIEQENDGGLRWLIRSEPPAGVGKPTDHALGRARFGGPRAPKRVDLDEIRRRCDRPEAASFEVEHEEDLGPRWRTVRDVRLGRNELLLALEMPAEFASDFEALKLHPALLDRASGMAKGSLGERGYYLPLGYRGVRIYGDLPPRVYSHARYREGDGADRETLTFDYTLIDEEGRVLVEAERMTQKRVNDPGAEIRALAENSAAAPPPPDQARREIAPAEGLDALDRLLAARAGSRVVVSVRDLQASIEQTDEVVRERIQGAVGSSVRADDRRPRPDLRTPYVAPRNDVEAKIAEAWQEVLGIDAIGVDDNFFDLGGDSVQAIQIISKGNQLGLKLNPQQFFQYSTISELAEVLGGMVAEQAEQGPILGPVPLVPEQRALLGSAGGAATKATRAVAVALREPPDADRLTAALAALAEHHDALRLRFRRGLSGHEQASAAPGDAVPLTLTEVEAGADLTASLDAAARGLETRLNASGGPLFAAALVRAGRDNHLVLVGSELVADAASFRTLLADLEAAYRLGAGGLPKKTIPFKRWAERLADEASSDAVQRQASSWLEGPWGERARLPLERKGGAPGPARTLAASLDGDETRALLDRLAAGHRAELSEALVAALARAISASAGGGAALVDVIDDGRQALEGLDLSRTVGCFALRWPLLVDARALGGDADAIKAVKERARRVQNKGLGYGLLRHTEGGESELDRLPDAEVAFCHLGAVEAETALGAWSAGRVLGERRSLGGRALLVESSLVGGRLVVHCAFDELRLPAAAAERLLGDLLATLRRVASEQGGEGAAFSPADFPLADLDESQLSALAALMEDESSS